MNFDLVNMYHKVAIIKTNFYEKILNKCVAKLFFVPPQITLQKSNFRKNWFMKTNSVRYSEFGCQQRGLDGFFSTCEIGENEFIWAQLDSSWEQVLQSRQSLFWIFIRWHIWTKWKIKCKNIQKRKEIYVHDRHYYSIRKSLENISF